MIKLIAYDELMASFEATQVTRDQSLVISNFVGDIGHFPEY